MSRALVLVPVGLLLAACGGSTSGTVLPSTGSTSDTVVLSAEPAVCAQASPTAKASTASATPVGPTCTIRVHYVNGTAVPLSIDADATRIIDSADSTYRPQAAAGAVTTALVKPAGEVSVDWIVALAPGTTLKAVTWTDPAGESSRVGLTAGSSTTPSATPTPKPTPTPTPKATATAKPKPTPTATRSRTSQPRPATSQPPDSGTIG